MCSIKTDMDGKLRNEINVRLILLSFIEADQEVVPVIDVVVHDQILEVIST